MKIWEYNPFLCAWEPLCAVLTTEAAERVVDALRQAHPLADFVYRDQRPSWSPNDPLPMTKG